jgi:hypothetical protein
MRVRPPRNLASVLFLRVLARLADVKRARGAGKRPRLGTSRTEPRTWPPPAARSRLGPRVRRSLVSRNVGRRRRASRASPTSNALARPGRGEPNPGPPSRSAARPPDWPMSARDPRQRSPDPNRRETAGNSPSSSSPRDRAPGPPRLATSNALRRRRRPRGPRAEPGSAAPPPAWPASTGDPRPRRPSRTDERRPGISPRVFRRVIARRHAAPARIRWSGIRIAAPSATHSRDWRAMGRNIGRRRRASHTGA